jgi:hypothetical protein
MDVDEEPNDLPEGLELWDEGLWRVKDNGVLVGWFSTSFFGFKETGRIDWLLQFENASSRSDDQPWSEGLAFPGSRLLDEVERGSITSDALGSNRTFEVAHVDDDEFELIGKEHWEYHSGL